MKNQFKKIISSILILAFSSTAYAQRTPMNHTSETKYRNNTNVVPEYIHHYIKHEKIYIAKVTDIQDVFIKERIFEKDSDIKKIIENLDKNKDSTFIKNMTIKKDGDIYGLSANLEIDDIKIIKSNNTPTNNTLNYFKKGCSVIDYDCYRAEYCSQEEELLSQFYFDFKPNETLLLISENGEVMDIEILNHENKAFIDNMIAFDKKYSLIYDEHGYDLFGFNYFGFDKDGYDKQGYNNRGYNKDGFNKDGYNEYGRDILNNTIYSKFYYIDGFDKDGYDIDGFNRSGYNKYGYDKKGYNRLGLDKEGFDENGYDRNGIHKEEYYNNNIAPVVIGERVNN